VEKLYREEVGDFGGEQQRRGARLLENEQELKRLLVADFFRCVSN